MTTKIFDAPLTTAFQPTKALLMQGDDVVLDFLFTIITGATGVLWYLEYTNGDPNNAATEWTREVTEEDTGGGVVNMAVAVRRFRANNATPTDLGVGDHALSTQFVRKHKYFRAQLAVAAGGGSVSRMRVLAQFGVAANSP